ncbi:MAG: SDR family NAD(P)-dependent oxidoreductase [Candidatus Dadabacteria bacterium]|nr:SDR family NAD(P)-dependent oxidoreductase [Candidatus Dadabacteria bacterium]
MKLKGKIALITGGSLGLGKATAILFAQEGATVIITGRTEKTLKEAVSEAESKGVKIEYLVSDVAKEEDCKSAVEETVKRHGAVDILFNNAGVLSPAVTHETETGEWDRIFAINVRGTFMMSKYTIPHMLKKGSGCIVNNSSVVGLKGVAGFTPYVASKGAVTQFTRAMALDYAQQGIRVNAICPGAIVTPMVTNIIDAMEDKQAAEDMLTSFHPMGRLGQPDEIARAVLFLCEDGVDFMTGIMLSVDGGWIAQ